MDGGGCLRCVCVCVSHVVLYAHVLIFHHTIHDHYVLYSNPLLILSVLFSFRIGLGHIINTYKVLSLHNVYTTAKAIFCGAGERN